MSKELSKVLTSVFDQSVEILKRHVNKVHPDIKEDVVRVLSLDFPAVALANDGSKIEKLSEIAEQGILPGSHASEDEVEEMRFLTEIAEKLHGQGAYTHAKLAMTTISDRYVEHYGEPPEGPEFYLQ